MGTNDKELREKASRIPGTPLLYLHGSAPTLEKPSGSSLEAAEVAIQARCEITFIIMLLKDN